MKTQFEKAEGELVEYFTTSIALRGQSYERDGGDGTPDPSRIERQTLDTIASPVMERWHKVHATIACVGAATYQTLDRAFRPRRHTSGRPRRELYVFDKTKETTKDLWGMLVVAFPQYTGLVPYAAAAVEAFERAHVREGLLADGRSWFSATESERQNEIMNFLEQSATRTDAHRLHRKISEEVVATARAALAEYEPHRRRRVEGERAAEQVRSNEIRNGGGESATRLIIETVPHVCRVSGSCCGRIQGAA